jgi:protease-4
VDAKRIGLIDELGGLNDAIVEAAKIAELTEYGIKKYPKYKTGLEKLMEDLGGASAEARKSMIEQEIGAEAYSILKQVKSAMEQKGVQARMPFVLDIK